MKTQEYRQENIEHVLDVTLELAKEIGVTALNKSNIAERAGLSTKSIQRYFDGKPDMVFQVSHKLLARINSDLKEGYKAGHPESMTGIDRFAFYLKIHNDYCIKHYKDLIFILNADLYCRFNLSEPDKYLKEFKKINTLANGIKDRIDEGLADKTIDDKKLPVRLVTLMCASIVEHLVNDVHTGIATVEDAIAESDLWIEKVVAYIGNKETNEEK